MGSEVFFVYFFRSVGDGVGDAKGRGNWVSCGGAKCKVGRGHRREVRSVGSSGGRIIV